MDIRPIKTETDYRAVLTEIEGLMHVEDDCLEGDRLDVLATLVEDYERKHFPIEAPDPIEAIKFMMEQKGISRRDLEPVIGSRGRVSEVLNHKRQLTVGMIRGLREVLGIPADVLIGLGSHYLP